MAYLRHMPLAYATNMPLFPAAYATYMPLWPRGHFGKLRPYMAYLWHMPHSPPRRHFGEMWHICGICHLPPKNGQVPSGKSYSEEVPFGPRNRHMPQICHKLLKNWSLCVKTGIFVAYASFRAPHGPNWAQHWHICGICLFFRAVGLIWPKTMV